MNRQNSDNDDGGNKHQPAGARRRGELLENAILQAAWDELNEAGYTHMTMEKVAARAKTNKNALYRRWPNKAELLVAALHKYMPKIAQDIPDTGNLRSDVLIMLRRITDPIQAIGAETIHGLIMDLREKMISAFSNINHTGMNEKWNENMMTILGNAKKRGEISTTNISPRILSLPIDLLRFEFLTTFKPVSDETVAEIVDEIFLPLIHT